MNLCKVMLAQSKAMKPNLLTAHGGSTGRVRFQGAKKRPAEGEEINDIVSNAVKKVLKNNKCLKAKGSNDSGSEDKQEHFNFDTLQIG